MTTHFINPWPGPGKESLAMSRPHKGKSERYVKQRFWLLNSPAWQSLRPAARPRPSAQSEASMLKSYFGCDRHLISSRTRRGREPPSFHLAGRRDEKARPRYCANRAKGF